MDYDEDMRRLNNAAHAAVRAALNHDGAPVHALKELAADTDSLIDTGLAPAQYRDALTLPDLPQTWRAIQ